VSGDASRCVETRQRLALLHAGEPGPADRIAIDAHLASCGDCRREAEEIEETLRAVAAAGSDVPDPGPAYWESFQGRLRARIRRDARARRRTLLGAAAVLVLAAALGALGYRLIEPDTPGTAPPALARGEEAGEAEERLRLLLRRAAAHQDGLRAAEAALEEILPPDGADDEEAL
jgi:hypothetical protein